MRESKDEHLTLARVAAEAADVDIETGLGFKLRYDTREHLRRMGVTDWDTFCDLPHRSRKLLFGWGPTSERKFCELRPEPDSEVDASITSNEDKAADARWKDIEAALGVRLRDDTRLHLEHLRVESWTDLRGLSDHDRKLLVGWGHATERRFQREIESVPALAEAPE